MGHTDKEIRRFIEQNKFKTDKTTKYSFPRKKCRVWS